jgi:hypothetical protein
MREVTDVAGKPNSRFLELEDRFLELEPSIPEGEGVTAMIGTYAPSPYDNPMRRVRTAPVTVYGTRWCAASQMVRRTITRR